jgi:hypothetical protein
MSFVRKYPEPLPFHKFISLIHQANLELQKIEQFLQKVTENPILLFEEAHIYLKSHRNMVVSVINTPYVNPEKIKPQDFQIYLGSLLDKAIKEWAEKRNLPYDVSVRVRNPNYFPSLFAVYVDGHETIQFHLFEKWYGIRQIILSDQEVRDKSKKITDSIQEQIKEIEKEIQKWKKIQKNPFSTIKRPLDVFTVPYLVLFKWKVIKENLQKKIQKLYNEKSNLMKELEKERKCINEQIHYYQMKKKHIDAVLPFFKELNYTLQTEKHKLY